MPSTKGSAPLRSSASEPPPSAAEAEADVVAFGDLATFAFKINPKPTGYFAGNLASFGIAEVFESVLTGNRSGTLLVEGLSARKQVTFRDGEVAFASSSEPYERLGSILIRRKVVTAAQLKEALLEVKPGKRLGQVLTHTGWVSAPTVYAAMTDLVREIILGLFTQVVGDFLFLEGVNLAPDETIRLTERSRDLVLEGLKREGEVAKMRKAYPAAMRLAPAPAPGTAPNPSHDEQELSLLQLAKGGAAVSSLRTKFDGGDFVFFSTLDFLVKNKALLAQRTVAKPPSPARPEAVAKPEVVAKPEAPPKPEAAPRPVAAPLAKPAPPAKPTQRAEPAPAKTPAAAKATAAAAPKVPPPSAPPIPPIIESHRQVILALSKALREAGHDLNDLKSFLTEPLPGMESGFAGVTLSDEGALDVARVLQNFMKADPKTGEAKAVEAVSSFVSYAMFTAKNVLPAERLRALARSSS